MSIQDKLMKKSFATKVLHENNQRLNSMMNNKGYYQQSGNKEVREPPMEKSQDIRNLLDSSNMSVNDESSQTEKPFLSNEKMNLSGQSPQGNSPNYPDVPSKFDRLSIRGLEPYTEKTTHKNDLKVVNNLNYD